MKDKENQIEETDGTYAYNSTFKWVKSVYAGFSQNSIIRLKVMEEIK